MPYPPGQYRTPASGKKFVGLRIRQCVRLNADLGGDTVYSTYNGEWFAASPNGNQATSSSSWNDWPAPKFPESVSMTPGDCLRGWVEIEVPKRMHVAKVVYRSSDVTVAEWLLR